MTDLLAIAPWLETLRDTSAVIVAMGAAVVSVSTAAKVPFISRPIRYVGRKLFAEPLEAVFDRWVDKHLSNLTATVDTTAAQVAEIDGRVAGLDGRLESIEHEVLPNNGSSLRDAVSRTESRCDRIDAELTRLLPLYAPRPQA